MSLIEQRSLMISLSQHVPPESADDADFANNVTFLLGRVINRCLSINSPALSLPEWESMKSELDVWKASLPSSFDPIKTPGLGKQSNFPSIWALRGWHGEYNAYNDLSPV